MADDRWNESRSLWGDERRRERERQRMREGEDYGQPDHDGPRAQRHAEPHDDRGYRPFGDTGPVNSRSGGYTAEGRPYHGGRPDDLPPGYRDFEAAQRRIHRGDYAPDRYTPNPREGVGEEGRSWWNRTEDEVTSWFGDESARRRREWDKQRAEIHHELHGEHRGRGPKGYRRSDERIREDINDRLTDDPLINASDIEVSVKDGEATLSGAIYRREDKRRAEDLAEAVSGVAHVQNNLRMRRDDTDSALAATGNIPL